MDILDHYPTMTPYVGSQYGRSDTPSILLLGESHYLPTGSVQHLTPEAWYSGNETTLDETEIAWISTSRIIKDARRERFPTKSHWTWKNPILVINEAGPQYNDPLDAFNHTACCNFFVRPAKEGVSLDVTKKDVWWATARLHKLLREFEPDALIFISRLASSCWEPHGTAAIPTASTPHPTSPWWNRTAKVYGGKSGRQVLKDFVHELSWATLR